MFSTYNNTEISCDKCDFKTNNLYNAIHHKYSNNHIIKYKPNKYCSKCNKPLLNKINYDIFINKLNTLNKSNSDKKYYCEFCDIIFY
jgi:uncharacterized protein with PIN domain